MQPETLAPPIGNPAPHLLSRVAAAVKKSALSPAAQLSDLVDKHKLVRIPQRRAEAYKTECVRIAKEDGVPNPRWIHLSFDGVAAGNYPMVPKPPQDILRDVAALRKEAAQLGLSVETRLHCFRKDPLVEVIATDCPDRTGIIIGAYALDQRCIRTLFPNDPRVKE